MEATKIDTIKALYAYSLAAFIVVAGGWALVFVTDLDANTALVLAGFMGSALTFVFGQESSTRAARQYAGAVASSGNGHAPPKAPGTVTTTTETTPSSPEAAIP